MCHIILYRNYWFIKEKAILITVSPPSTSASSTVWEKNLFLLKWKNIKFVSDNIAYNDPKVFGNSNILNKGHQ